MYSDTIAAIDSDLRHWEKLAQEGILSIDQQLILLGIKAKFALALATQLSANRR